MVEASGMAMENILVDLFILLLMEGCGILCLVGTWRTGTPLNVVFLLGQLSWTSDPYF